MLLSCSPDKNPNVKGVHERFARLGVISTILRGKESRKRYDIGLLASSVVTKILKLLVSF